MQLPKRIQIQKFIESYLREHTYTDMTDELFNELFFQKFGGSRKVTNWGAQPNRLAAKHLLSLYRQGILDRGRVSLGSNWQPGFPRWVYGYSLRTR